MARLRTPAHHAFRDRKQHHLAVSAPREHSSGLLAETARELVPSLLCPFACKAILLPLAPWRVRACSLM